jgi:cyanophycin synthetase
MGILLEEIQSGLGALPMQILNRQQLTGINRWFCGRTLAAVVDGVPEMSIASPVLRALVDALERLAVPAYQAGAGERLRRALPLDSSWGRALIELASELQFLSGEVNGARTERRTGAGGIIQVALECSEFALAEACLDVALGTCTRLQRGEAVDLTEDFMKLSVCAEKVCLGGSTGPIAAAARRRGIPTYRRDAESLVQLGEGIHQQHIYTAMTSRTSQIAVQVSTDKYLVGCLWEQIGIPVPSSHLVHDEEEAVQAAEEIGWPIVVKPADADYGRGVSILLRTAERVRAAYAKAKARTPSGRVLVQRYLRGASHRFLLVNGRLAAAVRREPIGILGNGRHSVRELVEEANRNGCWGLERRLTMGDSELALLAEAGFAPETVAAPGVKVPLSHDLLAVYNNVTESVHPDTRELACDAARVVGLDVGGLDAIAQDISRPLEEQGGGFLEINAEPALAIHDTPHSDRPQPVGEAIVASLFPPPARGRIPLIVFLGGREIDEAVHFSAELLHRRGVKTAVSTPEQTRCNRRLLHPISSSPADRLSTMMLHPRTEAAVFRVTLAEVLQLGLGADQCDVLVFAGGCGDGETNTDEEARELLNRLIAATKRCVINLDEPYWSRCAAITLPNTVLVSSTSTHPSMLQHLATGRMTAFAQGAEIRLRAGEGELTRIPIPTSASANESDSVRRAHALAASAVFTLGLDTMFDNVL